MIALALVLLAVGSTLAILYFIVNRKNVKIATGDKIIPTSVNYHFTRECNYKCGFCFHTQLNSDMLSEEDAKKGLVLLKEAGMKKINFAGGEPFLKPKFLGSLVEFCKKDLKLESVSIVSNGSKITKKWFENYGKYIDVLAISVDSFNEEINKKIGRGNGKHIKSVYKAKEICEEFNIIFKLNSVVNIHNYNEDMNSHIAELNPKRWKVFQCLILEGENSGGDSIRNALEMVVTEDQMDSFLKRHDQQKCLVPERNDVMQNSYLLLDEKMRFLNCVEGKKDPTQSILEVGVEKAIKNSGFSNELFEKRGGIYEWTKEENSCNSGCEQIPELEW